MKNLNLRVKLTFLFVIVLTSSQLFAQNPNFHIYLCFGQSNMEGCGTIEEKDKVVDSRFKMMATVDCRERGRVNGNWYTAIPPLSQCWAGLSPVDYFGRTMIKNFPDSVEIGVLSVAVGGCDIRLFDKDIYQNFTSTYEEDWFQDKIKAYGGNPYERFISLAQKAQNDGVIKGILLHQGETNTGDKDWPLYVKKIYENILADLSLKAEDVPLLAGEVVHEAQHGKCAEMNSIINKLPEIVLTAKVIASEGCDVRTDSIHFNSAGVRELGKRYAETMLEVIK